MQKRSMKFQSSGLMKLPAMVLLLVGLVGFVAQKALADPTAACQHGVRWPNECPQCRAMYGGGSSGGGNYNSGPSLYQQQQQEREAAERRAQEEADEVARRTAAAQEAAQKKAENDAEVAREFQHRKLEAMSEMKGIDDGLPAAGSGGGLKGLYDSSGGGLKGLAGIDDEGLKDAVADRPRLDQKDSNGQTVVPLGKSLPASGLKVKPVERGAAGTDKKASDQLMGASGIATKPAGDLGALYDEGRAQKNGTVNFGGGYSYKGIDPSTFSDKVRNDKRMVAALAEYNRLKQEHTTVQNKLDQAVAARNAEKDTAKFAELSKKVEALNQEYHASVAAGAASAEKVEKLHRSIDTEGGEDAPAATPQKK